mgnify:CR=1 FL=1
MSDRVRQIKDPIYGYIYLPDDYVQGVVDTPEFQRLRKISQTSYEALYPSATHNRFAHSLGVFHLGSIVAEAIQKCSLSLFGLHDSQQAKYAEYLTAYRKACLLHDVGHAPLSHTSEDFYITKLGRNHFHEEIAQLTGDDKFLVDAKSAAPHELMSVLVALHRFGDFIGDARKQAFFARAITGYLYNKKYERDCNDDGVSYSFLNALISLLNSKVIDVDRLDYLIRDAFQTGFETVNIDHKRLLKAVRIRKYDGVYERVFSKDALSVLENAVYAHDAEKKWVQTHLSIRYEGYLLENAIRALLSHDDFAKVDVFCEQSLSVTGAELPIASAPDGDGRTRHCRIRLMSDGDIMFLLKNSKSDFASEYFSRGMRKHPLWKTEHEYKAYFEEEQWHKFFKTISSYDSASAKSRINEGLLENCSADVESKRHALENASDKDRERCQDQLSAANRMLKWVEAFKSFAEVVDVAFDFVLLQREPFASGFNRGEFAKLKIEVPGTDRTVAFKDATEVLFCGDGNENPLSDETYYLFMQKPAVGAIEAIKKFKSMFRDLI